MVRRAIFALVLLIIVGAPQSAQADGIPVYVRVSGTGTIRVRIADGPVGPCSSGDELLFDGDLSAGQTVVLNSSRGVLCVEHTYGTFRKANWTSSSFVRQYCARRSRAGASGCESFIRVELSTDRPFGLR